jgi:leucyl aminopeptidase
MLHAMKFAFHGQAPLELACDLLVLPIFDDGLAGSEPGKAVLSKLGDVLSSAMTDERFEGKPGQSLVIHTHGKLKAKRLALLGCGKLAAFEADTARHLAAPATRAAAAAGAASVALVAPTSEGQSRTDERFLQLYLEGAQLGRYKFGKYLTAEEARRTDPVETFILAADGGAASEAFGRAVKRAQAVATAIGRARDMINEPAGVMTPTRVAELAKELAQKFAAQGLQIEVLGPAECKKLGMGMFLGVAQGSVEEPRFVHMTYKGKGAAGKLKKVALVGKGVTFDSGGHSLKPSEGMLDMKVDMSGSAAVINAIAAIAELGAPVEVHAYAALTENMLSGSAYKLGDVLISMAGKTVEINNTDAEGRLTLGDAITYALRDKPDEIIDFATLTGACVVALGPHTAGVMSNDDALCKAWLTAAKATGEDMWQLPLTARLRDQLKSEIADMKNTGERWGGAITAGLFLKEFVGETPWVHVDIAGPATSNKELGAISSGGVGFAVSTMIEYLVPRA